MDSPRLILRVYSRREALRLGAAALATATVAPACDTLTLPEGTSGTGEPLDPITPVDEFYVQHCCGAPEIDGPSWRLAVSLAGTRAATLDLAFLEGLAAREKEHTLECIGGGPSYQAIGNAVWEGLPFAEVLAALGVAAPSSAVEVKFTCEDGYSTSVPIADLGAMWLVWRMNGEPLTAEHGFPARFLVPGRYGTKNPKWPVEVDLVDEPYVGYWEQRGWSNDATYHPNTLVRSPPDAARLDLGPVSFVGTAFAGTDPVEAVEVSTDGGGIFVEAERTYAGGPDVWTLWRLDWDPPGPGRYTVQARMRTVSGATSSPSPDATDRLSGYDGSMEVTVEVV